MLLVVVPPAALMARLFLAGPGKVLMDRMKLNVAMKIITHYMLAGLLVAGSIQSQAVSKTARSARQPFPEKGFWVVETVPGKKSTIVRYYAHSNHLMSQATEPVLLDVRKVSVRKYLNEKLRKELGKDTTGQAAIKLYEID